MEQFICINIDAGITASFWSIDRLCSCFYGVSRKKASLCDHYGNLYAAYRGNVYSVLYYFGRYESVKYIYRSDHFKLRQHFWNLFITTGIYASAYGIDRGSKDRWSKSLENFMESRRTNDEIIVYYIWFDELYYLLQQLYVAIPDHG